MHSSTQLSCKSLTNIRSIGQLKLLSNSSFSSFSIMCKLLLTNISDVKIGTKLEIRYTCGIPEIILSQVLT